MPRLFKIQSNVIDFVLTEAREPKQIGGISIKAITEYESRGI